jgi:hypothetical protein
MRPNRDDSTGTPDLARWAFGMGPRIVPDARIILARLPGWPSSRPESSLADPAG